MIKDAIICARCGKTDQFSHHNVSTMTRVIRTAEFRDGSGSDREIALCGACVSKFYKWLDALEKGPEA